MGTPVKIDAAAPQVFASLIGKDASGNVVINRETTNTPEYINNRYSYIIKIVADDGTDGSGIDADKLEVEKSLFEQGLPCQITNRIEDGKTIFEIEVNETALYNCTIYDKAGNSKNVGVYIQADNTEPTITDMYATVSKGGATNRIDNSSDYYNKDCDSLTLEAKVTDDKALDKVYMYYKMKGDASYTKVEATTNSGTDIYTCDATGCGSGEYSFYFEATDKAGNTTTALPNARTFKVDRTPPEVGTVTYEYREKNEDGNWGAWKEWKTNSHNKYVFNTALMDASKIEYSVVMPITDDFSGYAGSMDKGSFRILGPASVTDLNRARGTFDKRQLENDPVAQVAFYDVAGNYTVDYGTADYEASDYKNYVLRKDEIEIAGMDIEILSNTLKIYETGKPENELDLSDFASGNIDVAINKSYTISVAAVSGYEINAAELYAELSGHDIDNPDTLNVIGVCGENTFDITEGKNKSVVTFVVPSSEILNKKNEWLKNIKLKVIDNRPEDVITDDDPNFAETTIGQILYDISRPRLESTNADDEWHKKFDSLTYNIVSEAYMVEGETLPEVESGLSWLNYEITNSKDGDITGNPITGLSGVNTIGADIDDIPESLTPYGTIITFNAEDVAGNGIYDTTNANAVVVKVDKTAPKITQLTVNNQEGGNHPVPYGGQPVIKATASDNLTLDKAVIEVVYPDGTTRGTTTNINKEANGSQGITETANYTIEAVNGKVLEGEYRVTTYAVDKAGRESCSRQTTFRIDNSNPVVTARVIAGTASPKTIAPYYYKDNVAVELTYQDNYISSSGVLVSDNGNTVGGISWMPVEGTPGKYRAVIAVAAEGSHNITINATDLSGNKAEPKAITFVVDKTSPDITAYVNGTTVYNDSMGNLMLSGTATVSMEVSDMTRDAEDNYVQIQKNVPNEPASNPAYIKTSNTYMTFNDEADYVVNFYSIDRANNTSATKTVRFRVDRTAPVLSISGGAGTSSSARTVTFTMREAFWWDADASLTIYRKAGDGAREELYKTVSFNPSAYQTSVSETLSQTGVYRFEFEARDNVGHRSQLSQTFTMDLNAPVVVLKGVNDYDMTDGAVDFLAEITDEFYSSKTVKVTGTRTDVDGKVHKLDFGTFLQSVNPTKISQTFTESGVYDITLVTSDIAGNERTENIHFTIDNAAPVIGDLSKYDGKIFKSFSWDEDLDELVSDLTVCDVQMFLNGSEYDGSSDIEDGSYVLLIVATDEMGQRTEKEVRFELDTKAPVFIVTGVENKEVKNEDYIINVSLQLDEDTLSSVTLNGTNISVRDNTATINVTEKGEYTLVLKAYDAAGNEAEETITFTYGEEKSLWWIWIIIACGIILLGMIIIIVVKKKKEDEQ